MNADEIINRRTDTLITRQSMHVWRNTEARSCRHWCSGNAINITYCECLFVALGIQHAMHTHLIFISGLPYSTIFFSHYLINGRIFGKKKVIGHKICVWITSTIFVRKKFIIIRRSERDMIKNLCQYSCEVPVILAHFNDTWIFSKIYEK